MEDIQIAKRYMRTCSASLIIRKWKSKPQWDIISPLLGWWFSKRKELSIGRSVKKRKPSSAVGRDINWCSQHGKQYRGSLKNLKLNYHVIQQSYFSVYWKEMKSLFQRSICTSHVYYSIIHSGQDTEITDVSIDGWMVVENTMCIYTQWSVIHS